ncbi:MBL fold metallo-hydrolase [Metabacillus indicus]|uniref:MBL fold metallo-hydrolase n=1 Tax=Metabacillus indicus TaxID=246786 RepID=UPI002A039F0B|nr:MBL fold metallo-hydrolase [Metabacillus indicus]MDX8289491.1 MBL fold metallo-hydrolase [Metabacillus indicus]
MKITVVGFWGGFPAVNEASSGYLFESDGFRLLVDCGSAVLSQLQNYAKPEELDAVILSHYHHDHIADVGPLQFARLVGSFMNKSSRTLPIYGHSADAEAFAGLTYKEVTAGKAYNPEESIQIGPFHIRFMKTKHPVDCYAMRISDGSAEVVYTADSSYREEFVPFSKDADLLLCECNFYGDMDGSSAGHMNSLDAGRLAEHASVKELILTHLPHFGEVSNLVSEAETIYKGPVRLAASGLQWTKGN